METAAQFYATAALARALVAIADRLDKIAKSNEPHEIEF